MTTDTCYNIRKNAQFSNVVCLGVETHKVLTVQTVTKEDEQCTQKHELLGTKRVYEHLDNAGVVIAVHGHDNAASVTN